MLDYTRLLPSHEEKYVGENDLFLEVYKAEGTLKVSQKTPLLFVHGAYTGSWMWSKFIPHFIREGYTSYVMNLRSHYKSRVLDMSNITFDDYLVDIQQIIDEITEEYGITPIVIGFSMGGILSQKLAETQHFSGLVLVDSVISREVFEAVPYPQLESLVQGLIAPAPVRELVETVDESIEDIVFQKRYLSMESAKAYNAFKFSTESIGISIENSAISCPCLVINAVNSETEEYRGQVMAEQLRAEYIGLWNKTHTGLLVGQHYMETVDTIIQWINKLEACQ